MQSGHAWIPQIDSSHRIDAVGGVGTVGFVESIVEMTKSVSIFAGRHVFRELSINDAEQISEKKQENDAAKSGQNKTME